MLSVKKFFFNFEILMLEYSQSSKNKNKEKFKRNFLTSVKNSKR